VLKYKHLISATFTAISVSWGMALLDKLKVPRLRAAAADMLNIGYWLGAWYGAFVDNMRVSIDVTENMLRLTDDPVKARQTAALYAAIKQTRFVVYSISLGLSEASANEVEYGLAKYPHARKAYDNTAAFLQRLDKANDELYRAMRTYVKNSRDNVREVYREAFDAFLGDAFFDELIN